MKKMRVAAVLALALAGVMLLSSCATMGGKDAFVKLLDPEAAYEEQTVTYATSAKVDALTGKSYREARGDLVYFTDTVEKDGVSYTQHVVYNLKTNNVVRTVEDTATSKANVTLDYAHLDGEMYAYFLVTAAGWEVDGDGNMKGRYTVRTELYDCTGTYVAGVADNDAFNGYFNADHVTTPDYVADMLYFNGILYRFGEDGKLNRAIEYGTFVDVPYILDYNDEYYVAYESDIETFVFYNKQMEQVATYALPGFEVENLSSGLLRNGKLLLQYWYELEEDAKDYTFVYEKHVSINGSTGSHSTYKLAKYQLVTLLVDAKSGKAKEIKCDYLIDGLQGSQHDQGENSPLVLKDIEAFGEGYKIVDGRVSEIDLLLTFDKNGKASELIYNGESVWDVRLVSDSRVLVQTELHDYLLDREGALIGRVDNAEWFGSYLLSGNKVYDYDLTVKLDLFDRNYAVYDMTAEYLLLENAGGDVLLYTGDSDPVKIEDDGLELVDYEDDYYLVEKEIAEGDNELFVYNAKGVKIASFNYKGEIDEVKQIEDAILLRVRQAVGETTEYVYYRVTK